jgi:hypothetical protein
MNSLAKKICSEVCNLSAGARSGARGSGLGARRCLFVPSKETFSKMSEKFSSMVCIFAFKSAKCDTQFQEFNSSEFAITALDNLSRR